jgi:hypothetical protein
MDRVLMLGASPDTQATLEIGGELALLRERLPIKSNRMAALSAESTDRFGPEELTPLLTSGEFDILHIVGHGTRKAFIANAKVKGVDVSILPEQFVNALRRRQDPVVLVVLCACFSSDWADTFLQAAHAVVSMPSETYELSAREFSISLYENLYAGMSLQRAVNNAQLHMRSLGDTTTTPKAVARDDQNPDEIYLFREPELLARFEEDTPKSKRAKNGTVTYFPVIYVAYMPNGTSSVRIAVDVQPEDDIWEFDLIEREGESFEIEYESWGNANIWALIDLGDQQRAIRSNLVRMLRRHYELVGGRIPQPVQAAIAALERDGKPLPKSPRAPGKVLPRKAAAAKKVALKK